MHTKRYQPADIKDGKCPNCGSRRLLYSGTAVTCTNCDTTIGKQFSKYGAKKQRYNGHDYDSRFEAGVAQYYDLLLRSGEIISLERQVRIPLEAYGVHICNYIIDFIATYPDGHKEYIEAKGYETDVWKIKWKMLEAKLAIEEPTSEMTLLKQGNMPKKRG